MMVGTSESEQQNTPKINKLSANPPNTKNRSPKIALAADENPFFFFHISHSRITQMSQSRRKIVLFIPFAFVFAGQFHLARTIYKP